MRYKIRIKHLSTKFFLLSLVFCLTTLCFSVVILSITYNDIIEKSLLKERSDTMSVIKWNLDMISNDIKDLSNMVLASESIQTVLSPKFMTSDISYTQKYNMKIGANRFLADIVNNKSYIDELFVGNEYVSFNQKPDFLSDSMNYSTLVSHNWYEYVRSQYGSGVWFRKGDILQYYDKNVLFYVKTLRSLIDLDEIGVLFIRINQSLFDDMFRSILKDQQTGIIVASGEREIYRHSYSRMNDITLSELEDLLPKGTSDFNDIIKLNNEKFFVSSISKGETWSIYSLTSYDYIMRDVYFVRSITVTVSVVMFIVTLIGTALMSGTLTSKIRLLRHSVIRFKNGQGLENITFTGDDEISQLGRQFIQVAQDNRILNDNLYRAVVNEKDAALQTLQAQINPHFLYNTLNSLFWMAQKHQNTDIAKMVLNLSNFFKLSLNNGDKYTRVSLEIEQIKAYLDIQNMRYDNKFSFVFNIPPECLELKILKFLLQPIVENAVHHGLEPLAQGGSIEISCYYNCNNIIFEIADNGVGFELQEKDLPSEGYALKNISERIKLNYGKESSLKIDSQIGKGTVVKIILNNLDEQKEDVCIQ